MTLTKRQRRELVRLLFELQIHLESAIESHIVPGTDEPRAEDRAEVESDRKLLKAAKAWTERLCAAEVEGD